MKRIIALILLVSLVLCACAPGKNTEQTTLSTGETTQETTQETTVETTEAPAVYINPLNGKEIDQPYTGRPTAVVINNVRACLPQYGIGQADMIFEFEVEGNATRLLAVFSSLDGVETIGPVRSARTFFNNVAVGYDAPLIHCGGSADARAAKYDHENKLTNWEHIDQTYNGKYFYRDTKRRSEGYALEHTLFTTGEKLVVGLADKGYNTVSETAKDFGMTFAENASVTGESASKVTVKFRANKKTEMTYNETTGLYEAFQLKENHIDAGTGERIAYRNVLVLTTKQEIISEGNYPRAYYDLIGSGEGYFAIGGQIVPIKWSRASLNDPFVYTFADGTPVTLGVGTTYVGVISDSKGTVTCE